MIKTLLSSSLLVAILTGCGSDSSSSSSEPIDYDGAYNMSALSTTKLDYKGEPCGNAFGTMYIDDSEVSGRLIDTWGQTYNLIGDVSRSGDVIGGFAVSGTNIATFEGHLSGDTGRGTWEDIGQCEGTWEATKN